MMPISSTARSSSSRTMTGTSCRPARWAARQRRSPAMISIAVRARRPDGPGWLQHALLADEGGEALQVRSSAN